MSALPRTPLTITPRPAASPHAHSPSQREGAGGWVPTATDHAASHDHSHAHSPSQREGAGGRARLDSDPDLTPPHPVTPSPSHDPLPIFHPSATTAATIINELASNEITLLDIADRHETTLEALTLWMIRPDIAERLNAFESACARRARLTVANSLNAIANTLLHLLAEAKDDHASVHRVPAATHHAFAARMQSRESARKAANLLLRIARYTPLADNAPPTPHHPKKNPTRERAVSDAPLAPPPRSAQPTNAATPTTAPVTHPSAATPRSSVAPLPASQPPTSIPIVRVAASPSSRPPIRASSRTAPQDHHGPQPPVPTPDQHHPP